MHKAIQMRAQFHRIFHIPLSEEAFVQYVELLNLISEMPHSNDSDRWEYIWGTGTFSCTNAHKHLKGQRKIHPAFNWLWKSACQMKHRIFFWLLLQDKLSTRERLRRRNMILDDYNCVGCGSAHEELVEHLFLKCPFAVQCWALLNLDSTPVLYNHFRCVGILPS